MDSNNSSGSLQSSSGGGGGDDDTFDSRATDSSFVHPSNNPLFNPSSQSQPPPPLPSSMFDHYPPPLSNYFDPLFSSNSRPNPNHLRMIYNNNSKSQNHNTQINPFLITPDHQFQSPPTVGGGVSAPASSSSTVNTTPADQVPTTTQAVPRNPKKRSRASRRAPTTVLTTDTSNFRAMVQEFTGIPAPPFTSSTPFPRTRFDLFGTSSSIRSNPLNLSQTPISFPHNLLRPFPQKQPPPLHITTSSSSTSTFLNNSNNILSPPPPLFPNTATNTPSPELALLKNPHPQQQNNMQMQMQNPLFTFQSFLQPSSPKYPPPDPSSLLASKTLPESSSSQFPSTDSRLKIGGLDEFNLNYGHVSNLNSSENGDRNNCDLLQNVTNGKVNYDGRKGLTTAAENVCVSTIRGEGIMESWLCSSD